MKPGNRIKAALVVASSVFCALATAQQPDRLTISRAGDAYVLAVPAAKEFGEKNRAAIESILKSIAVKEKPGA
jgi:hypothetical protein